jgi:hypothetical protein
MDIEPAALSANLDQQRIRALILSGVGGGLSSVFGASCFWMCR